MNTKTIITTCLLLLGAMALQAQELKWFKDSYGKYGYKDQDGKIIIEPKYENAHNFSEGLAAVSVGGNYLTGGKVLYGFIDRTGKEIVPPKYDGAEMFSEGLAAVRLNGKWGFIDKAGNIIIPLQFVYEEEPLFPPAFGSNGRAQVEKDDRYIVIDKTGKEVQ